MIRVSIPDGCERLFCIVARNAHDKLQRCIYADHRRQQHCRDGCPVARELRPDAAFPKGTHEGVMKVEMMK
jgi:hypothetical protein